MAWEEPCFAMRILREPQPRTKATFSEKVNVLPWSALGYDRCMAPAVITVS